jgi:tetratricopeptide (TPR) repeat protein
LPLEPLWRAELARLLPELATGEGLPPPLEPEEERRRLLEAIAQGFLSLAAAAPGLALLEDAHWMDPTSLEALRYLLPRLGEAPLHVVLTVRSEDLAGQQRDLLTALENTRLPQRLDLARLDPAETAELVQRALDLAQPAPRFSARLYAETEGNPFFLIETLWALTDEGLLYRDQDGAWSTSWDESTSDYGELPLPSGVAQSIQRRLQRLPAPLGELLSLAAVIGRELDFDLWRQASQRDAEELLAAGDKLCARGLLLPADPGTGADYTFAHAQIRRVAYDQLAAPRRRLYHRRAAQALTQLAPDEPENLAHHWTQAEAWDKAADYHQLAGDRAGAVYANDEAVTHYTQALKALEWQARPMDPARAFDLLLAREKVHNLRGERAAQADDLTALETLAQQLDDDQRRAQVALRRARCAETTGNYPAACAAAQAAIELAQAAQDVHSEASGYLRWGRALLRQGDHQAAQARLARALALAQAAALDQAQADSLHSLGIGAYRYGDLADARAYFHRALDAYRKSGDRRGESASLNGLGVFASDQGDFEQAISFYEQSLLICREIGRRQGENSALNNLGLVAHRQEDYARASAFYQQSLLISREIGDRMCESNTLGNLGLTAQNQGDYARARVYNQQSLHICREIGDGLAESNALNNLGIIAYYLGDYVRARSYLEQALSVCREVGDRRAEGWGLSSLALLFYQLRDDQAALEYNQQAIHIAQELGDRRLLGQALTSLGDALAGLGRLDQAASAYQRAFDLRCELGQPHRAMASLAGLARVCLDQGDLAQAQARVEEISRYLETRALDDADEPFRVYLTCYHVLRANQDPRAGSILHTAHALLQERAARIKDEELRRSFLENVAAHREIVAAYHKLQTHPPTLQLTVSLPRASAPTGRPLRASEYVSVTWTVAAPGDDAIPKKKTRRQRRLLRLLKEAREQGAAPTVGDLAQALDVSQPTIRRDLAALRQAGHAPQTRGSRENAD